MGGVSVSDRNNGYKAMMHELDKSKRIVVTVGIHSEEGEGADGTTTVIQVAEWFEFGTEKQPARAPISKFADANESRMNDELGNAIAKANLKGKSGAIAADQLAQKYAGDIQATFAAGLEPPNAPSTIAKKGSDKPGIDTGQMRSSIRGKVSSGD